MQTLTIRPLLLLLCLVAGPSWGLSYSASDGSRSAMATFSVSHVGSSYDLVINLSNTATSVSNAGLDPSHVLTGLFFNIAGSPTLTALSANVGVASLLTGTGSSKLITTSSSGVVSNVAMPNDNTGQPTTNVGSEWAARSGTTNLAHNAKIGISATGLGVFGGNDLFCQGGAAGTACPTLPEGIAGQPPDGLAFGLVPNNYSGGNGSTNGGVDNRSLISDTIRFLFRLPGTSGIQSDADLNISNVFFQYGTSLSEPALSGTPGGGTPGVPEPSSLALGALGLLMLRAIFRAKRA